MCSRLFHGITCTRSEENSKVTVELLLLCCEPCLEDTGGKSVNISAKAVSEPVCAKSSEMTGR